MTIAYKMLFTCIGKWGDFRWFLTFPIFMDPPPLIKPMANPDPFSVLMGLNQFCLSL